MLTKITFSSILPGATATTNPDAVSLWPKLVTWWQLDDAGTPLVDSHAHAINCDAAGTITYGATTVRSGGTKSVLFNGNSSSFASVSLDAYILGAVDHALFCWYSPTSITSSNERAILTSYNTGTGASSGKNEQLGMFITTAGKPESLWRYGSSSTTQLTPSTRALTGGSNYFLGYNKITTSKTVQWWINNVSETGIAYANEPTGTSTPPCIGALLGQTTYQAAGRLQNLTAFNATLTSTEIAWLYNSGAGRSYADLKTASGH
jgi:hypothetical protein